MATSSVISVIIGFAAFCNNGALSSPDFQAEQMTKQIESCDFDSSLCGYTPSPADDSWLVIKGSYPLHYARYPRIPPQDHDGRYLVPDINNKYIDVAITFSLTSPFITSGLIFIEFEYALQSLESTLRLSVKNTKNDDVTTVWETSNEEGGKWKRQTAVISSSDPFQITFQTSKKSDRGAVGIDDVRIWKVAPTSFGSSRPPVLETTINGISFPELISTTAKPTTTQGTPLTDQITMLSNVAELCGVHNPHTLPQGCDFGTDFCNYTHQPDTVWLRNNAIYPSGFAIGHIPVSPNGTYAVPNFVHFTSLINDNIATLTSPPINSGVICVEFLYSLQWHYSNLEVFAGNARLWQAPPYTCTSRQWTTHTLAVKSSGPFQLQFMSRKINVHGSVGIDSIQVWESFIPTTSTAAPTTSTTPNMSVTTTAPEATTHSSVTPSTTRSTNTSRATTPSSTATLSTTSPTTKPPPTTPTAPPTTPTAPPITPTAPPITPTAPPTTPTAPPTTPTGIVPQVTIPSNGSRLHQITNADDFCRTGGQRRLLPQSCTFDSDFCNFTYDQHESHPWELQKGSYSGLFTSIKASSNGTYVRKEFQFGGGQNPTSSLRTSVPEGDICVDFLYYLYGTTSNLRVVTTTPSDSLVVWNSTGKPTNSWGRAVVAVNSAEPVQLAFTTMKVDFRSLVGIDNISIWKIAP